jgi:hypothetical protein
LSALQKSKYLYKPVSGLKGWAKLYPLHSAARENDISAAISLIEQDPALVLSKDETGATPLHWAAFKGNKEIALLLLANKADVGAKARGGETPLKSAAVQNHATTVMALLANGADPDPDANGCRNRYENRDEFERGLARAKLEMQNPAVTAHTVPDRVPGLAFTPVESFKAPKSSPGYVRVPNGGGTYWTTCLRCNVKIAASLNTEAELSAVEARHRCKLRKRLWTKIRRIELPGSSYESSFERSKALREMAGGAALIVVGLTLMYAGIAGSEKVNPGGYYLVIFGPLVAGAVLFGKGFLNFLTSFYY